MGERSMLGEPPAIINQQSTSLGDILHSSELSSHWSLSQTPLISTQLTQSHLSPAAASGRSHAYSQA